MKAGLGVRLVAGAAFLAGAFAAALGALAATFLAGAAFFAGVFFAVAMMMFLGSEVSSSLSNSLFPADRMLLEKQALSKSISHFSIGVVPDCWLALSF
jgi:hypothetical protein